MTLLYAFLFISGIIYCPFMRRFPERNNKLSLLSKQGRTKRTTYCPLHKTFPDKCAVYCPVHLPFLPQTHTPRHRITFSPHLSFSIRDPDISGKRLRNGTTIPIDQSIWRTTKRTYVREQLTKSFKYGNHS